MLRRSFLSWPAAALAAPSRELRVMTFNVRYPARGDGPDLWELRRDLLVETIRSKDPDIIGTQELFYEQGEYIVSQLREYAWFGRSRRGNREDEHMGVFYHSGRLRCLEQGDFWLSLTPEMPGSMSWNMSLPRMVTWGRFEVKGSRRRFYLLNTHFPHRREDESARMECARLIAARLERFSRNAPLILTGDFNAPGGGEVYKILAGSLEDAWTKATRRTGPEGTFNGFKGITTGPRIDWILYRGGLTAVDAETITTNREGRYPSDHFPVFATLRFR